MANILKLMFILILYAISLIFINTAIPTWISTNPNWNTILYVALNGFLAIAFFIFAVKR